ncbi:alpha/beta hydrolase [Tistrella bauzanensis]|uniref:alpha/beta fold hydrolase n=1 Tax=Tistrella bauzanensis TaxID=657419 RepID=UPI00166F5B5D|nr:alpha/beta hydrolase [Tistrella bauzanensis]
MRALVDIQPAEPGRDADALAIPPGVGRFTRHRFRPDAGPLLHGLPHLHLQCWPGGNPAGRVLLLTHGTGYCGATLEPVALRLQGLAREVWSFDRRGHGLSGRTPGDYGFLAFTRDLIALADARGWRDIDVVAHSAGSTDVLLAAALRPDIFRRIVSIEPTVSDPGAPIDPAPGAEPSPDGLAFGRALVESAGRRRARFADRAAAHARFSTRPPFDVVLPDALDLYLNWGFRRAGDELILACEPATEADILGPIACAMGGIDSGDPAGDPFRLLTSQAVPVMVARTARSHPVFQEMAAIAARHMPGTRGFVTLDSAHLAPMEAPDQVADLARSFLYA